MIVKDNKTIAYYNISAERFADGTIDVDFEDVQKRFISYIPAGGYILDFGCGSGRDTKFFLSEGYKVDAVDGSARICQIAARNTGIPIQYMLFSELYECEKYDGIWACASILHLPKLELKDVFRKMITATKSGGYIYTSFKYGDFEGYRNERYFTDFTERSFREYISTFTDVVILEEWVSSDARPGRSDEKWLNLILQKTDTV